MGEKEEERRIHGVAREIGKLKKELKEISRREKIHFFLGILVGILISVIVSALFFYLFPI